MKYRSWGFLKADLQERTEEHNKKPLIDVDVFSYYYLFIPSSVFSKAGVSFIWI